MTPAAGGSRIAKVELHEFTYVAEGFARDPHGALCPHPAGVQQVGAFCLVIETADGHRGEYIPMHSGKNPAIVSQVAALAPRLVGMDAFAREGIWNGSSKAIWTARGSRSIPWAPTMGWCRRPAVSP